MSLDAILSHIINEANAQKEKIIADAKQKAGEIISQAREQAKQLYKEIVDREKAALESKRQKAIIHTRLEDKKRLLEVKQKLIDEVFENIKSQVNEGKLKKQQVLHDKVREVAQDMDFYFKEIRSSCEAEIAEIIFK